MVPSALTPAVCDPKSLGCLPGEGDSKGEGLFSMLPLDHLAGVSYFGV